MRKYRWNSAFIAGIASVAALGLGCGKSSEPVAKPAAPAVADSQPAPAAPPANADAAKKGSPVVVVDDPDTSAPPKPDAKKKGSPVVILPDPENDTVGAKPPELPIR